MPTHVMNIDLLMLAHADNLAWPCNDDVLVAQIHANFKAAEARSCKFT